MTEPNYTILIDSREQCPLPFINSKVQGLKTGDYSFEYNGVDYSDVFAIERKSGIDMSGSVGKNHDRFQRELDRSRELKYFRIIVEDSFTKIIDKKYAGAKHSQMKGETVIKILDTIEQKYNIITIFSNSRAESERIIRGKIETFIKLNLM